MNSKAQTLEVWVLGIDPGLPGALAFLNPSTKELRVYDMPLNAHKDIDLPKLALIVGQYSRQTLFATIEKVHSMPEQGVASTFTFGYAAGIVAGVVAADSIPIHFVRPAIWKLLLGLSKDKAKSLELARREFPAHATSTFKRKMDDGRAEASLLALFGVQRFLPQYRLPTK